MPFSYSKTSGVVVVGHYLTVTKNDKRIHVTEDVRVGPRRLKMPQDYGRYLENTVTMHESQ